MAERFDIERRWPDLFAQLSDAQRCRITEAVYAVWHGGWFPIREDIETLRDYEHGKLTDDDLLRGTRWRGSVS